jgi:hypothetical protein
MRFREGATAVNATTAKMAAAGVLCVLCGLSLLVSSCSRAAALFKQYEYEEEVYLSLDGTATVYVHASIAALNALRGTSFDTNPATTIDRAAIRAYFSTPVTHVTWVRPSRRGGRRFAHVRLEVDDIRRLSEAAPLAWSTYQFDKRGDLFVYRQKVEAAADKDVGNVGWTGREIVAFRLHLPSKIRDQNSGGGIGRGNILAWEQPLTDRLRGVPVEIDAQMDPESILYRTLWLFAATFVAVAAAFGVVIWWVIRRVPPTVPAEANSR